MKVMGNLLALTINLILIFFRALQVLTLAVWNDITVEFRSFATWFSIAK